MTNLQIALVKYREEHKLNQTQLAELIGCTRDAVSNWETGRTTPKAEFYLHIAEKLGCSAGYLIGDTPSPKEQLKGVKLAFYNQAEEISDEQAKEVLSFIEFIKNRDQNK